MSTWGGIGEGLTAGMNARIALEEQRRREALAQKNADRQFAFQQEQAQRAQANAERQMGNQELAAERAQSNADRDYSLRQRSADQDAQLKSMDMELRGMLGQLDAQMKQDELEGRREDRALSREKMQLDREKTAQELQMGRERLAGEKEERKLRKRLGLANIENARADIENKKANTEIAKSREAREARFGEIDRAFRQEQANIERAYKDKRLSLDERNAALREAESSHRIAMDDERMKFSREEAARNQGNVDADRALRREQLQATKEDAAAGRSLQERGLDIQENKNDRDDNYRDRIFNESVLQADREYALKKEAQNWQSKKAEEEWRTLTVAREELQSANRERQMQREAQQKSMSRQLSLAFQMLEDGGGNQTQLMMDDGSSVDARVLDAQDVAKIFGTDAAKRFAAVYAIDTPDEGTVFRVMNNDGSFMMVGDKPYFNEDARYKIYDRGFGKDAADRIMREAGQKRDLGMFAEKENIKAMADAKKLAAGGERGYLSALQTLIKEGNLSRDEETEVKNFMLDIMRNRGKLRGANVGGEGGEWAGFSTEKRNALERMGYTWDAATGRPVKNGNRPTVPFATRAGAWNK